MKRRLLFSAALLAMFAAMKPSAAAEPVPGDACSPANAFIRSGGPEASGKVYFMTCQGGVWVLILATDTNGNVGIGTTPPQAQLDVAGTDSILFPRGDGTNRPSSPVNGMMRYNTSSGKFEAYQGGSWQDILTTGAGGVTWNSISNPTGNQALTMGASTTTLTYNATTGASDLFKLTDTASNTGTGYLMNIATAASSTEKPFHVGAAGTNAITVLANGNVGIGTASPTQFLEVSGNVKLSDGGSRSLLGPAATSWSLSGYQTVITSSRSGAATNLQTLNGSGAYLDRLVLEGGSATASAYFVNSNVGIGNTSPAYKLDVTAGAANGIRSQTNFNGSYPNLYLENAENSKAFSLRVGGSISSLGAGNLVIYDETNAQPRMVVTQAGSVGIGTTTASSGGQLQVNEASTNGSSTAAIRGYITDATTAAGTNYSIGIASTAYKNPSSGVTDSGYVMGMDANGVITGPGTVNQAYGIRVQAGTYLGTGTGTINTAFGVYARVLNQGPGTITNGYGLYIEDVQATNGRGIYQQGTDDLNYFGGKTGIGVSPTYPLDVKETSSASAATVTRFTSQSDYSDFILGAANNYGSNNSSEDKWRIEVRGRPNTGAHSFALQDMLASNATRLFIDKSGNVGIGTTSPSELLDVNGRVHLAQGAAPATTTDKLYNVGGALYWNGAAIAGGGTIGGAVSGGTPGSVLFIDGSGNLGQDNSNFYWDSTNHRLGIGTATPALNLDLNGGSARIGNWYAYSNTLGSSTSTRGSLQLGAVTGGGAVPFSITSGDGVTYTGGNLTFATDGSSRLYINSTGNVGIGTTSPGGRLTVSNADTMTAITTNPPALELSNSDATVNNWAKIYLNDGPGQTAAAVIGAQITDHTNNYGNLAFWTRGSASNGIRMQIDSNGNVGIGTTSPIAGLDVEPASTASSGVAYGSLFQQTLTAAANNDILTALYINPTFADAGKTGVSHNGLIVGSGNVGIGTTSPNAPLHIAKSTAGAMTGLRVHNLDGSANSTAAIGFSVTSTASPASMAQISAIRTNRAVAADTDLAFSTFTNNALTEKMRIMDNGNVGIGTTSPSELLDVNGRVHLAQAAAPATTTDKLYNVGGALYWNGAAIAGGGTIGGAVSGGTPGSVLFIDGSGNLGQDNSNFYWDSTNHRLGIGTASPATRVDIENSTNSVIYGGYPSFSVGNANTTGAAFSGATFLAGTVSAQGVAGAVGQILASASTNASQYFWIRSMATTYPLYLTSGTTSGTTGITVLGNNVGIGTASPASMLHVVSATTPDIITENTSGTTSALRLISTGGLNYIQSGSSRTGSSVADLRFGPMATSLNTWMTIQGSTGNVGIATANPSTALQVNGVLSLLDGGTLTYNGGLATEANAKLIDFGMNEDSVNRFGGSYASAAQGGLFRVDTRAGANLFNWFGRAAGSTSTVSNLMSLTAGGSLGIGTTSPSAKLSVGSNQFFVDSSMPTMAADTMGMQYAASSPFSGRTIFGTDGTGWKYGIAKSQSGTLTDIITVVDNGSVGIGTTSPSRALDVSGKIGSTNGLQITDGTATSPNNELYFADNGQIRSSDDNHRIIFDRANNIIELREFGDLYFSPGATSGNRTSAVVMKSGGNVGVGTSSPATTLSVNGGVSVGVVTKTANYTATASDYVILCNANAGGFTITLPPASNKGQIIVVKKSDSSANWCTVATQGSDALQNGGTSGSLPNYSYAVWELVADGGTHWYTLNFATTSP